MTLELINEEEEKLLTEFSRINRTDRIDSLAFRIKDLKTLRKEAETDSQTDPGHTEVSPNVYYVPLLWAVDLVNRAKREKRITDHSTQRILIQVSCIQGGRKKRGHDHNSVKS